MTKVFSIFERIGLGGGGKVKAVIRRMNAMSEMTGLDPVQLNLDHNPNQKLNFAELQAIGTIAPGVRNLTVPEACKSAALDAGIKPFNGFPEYDHTKSKSNKTIYSQGGVAVMVDRTKKTLIGVITKRIVPNLEGDLAYTLINGSVHQLIQRKACGS